MTLQKAIDYWIECQKGLELKPNDLFETTYMDRATIATILNAVVKGELKA